MDFPDPEAPEVAGLPDDPLVEILSRVPFRSLCRFKCVSKAWRDLIANPIHRCKLPQTLVGLFYEIHHRRDRDGDDEGAGDDNIRSHGWVGFVDLLGRSMPLVDPFFSFLRKLHGSESIRIMDTCHGLLLLDRGGYDFDSIPSYVVCNPATKQWLAVPDFGWTPSPCNGMSVHLIFCPAMSSHFYLLQFTDDLFTSVTSVQIFSSKTGAWTHSESAWSLEEKQAPCERWRYESYSLEPERKRAVVNGMLYLICDSLGEGPPVLDGDHIIAVDVEGKTRKFIPVPFRMCKEQCSILSDFVGQSQGLVHYVNHEEPEYYTNNDGPSERSASEYNDDDDVEYELFIWILPEGDTQELVLKHTVSFLHLFGEKSCKAGIDYNVVAIHPDRDVIIFKWNDKLISYDMDTGEVCALHTVSDSFGFASYVPYFSELPALSNKY
ncbi:hypothetical protein SETIT_9G130600v2 [Setaria italica]|uniref:F-box domain-containing protein n=3 Tax=Setaria italica TaxID=4555 RepID=A0A368SG80_SETIT|nr:hypothetical protein SETIT_9G130600v2 [Setaria italica]